MSEEGSLSFCGEACYNYVVGGVASLRCGRSYNLLG